MKSDKVSSRDRESTPVEITEWLNNLSERVGVFNPHSGNGLLFKHANLDNPTHGNRVAVYFRNGDIQNVKAA